MLRINLLPKQQRAKISHTKKELVLLLLLLTGLVLVMNTVQHKVDLEVKQLKETKHNLSLKKRKLQAQISHINKLQKKHKKIQKKIDIIKEIRQQQSLPIRYLDILIKLLPDKKMWFQTLQMDQQGTIQLKGIAMDNQVFAQYLQDLRKTTLIQDIILKKTSKQNIDEFELISFQCQIKTVSKMPKSQKS